MILSLVREHDMPLMDHITNLEVSKSNEVTENSKSSATATISFSENEYFSNSTLTLKVFFEDADALSEESDPVKIVGTEINWKDGKNLTKVKTTKKQKNKKTGETRNVTKTVKQESFFNIYTSFDVPKQDSDEEEDEPDKEQKELFEQVGECCQIIEALHTMHDDPLSYYMGFGPSLEDLMAGQEGFEDVDGGSDSDEAPALVKGKK